MRARYGILALAFGVVALVIPVALGGTVTSEVDSMRIASGDFTFETTSGRWKTLTTLPFTSAGPLNSLSFSGEGYAQDFASDGTFKGKSLASMQVRLKIGSEVAIPGPMTFASNTGVIGSKTPRSMGNTLQWWYSGSGPLDVKIQVKNANPGDIGGLKNWSFTALYNSP